MREVMEQKEPGQNKPMQDRRIILGDGRYMIFYTFDESELPVLGDGAADVNPYSDTGHPSVEEDTDV
jgi:hypothetical protein